MERTWRWKADFFCLIVAIWVGSSRASFGIVKVKCSDSVDDVELSLTHECKFHCPSSCLDEDCNVIGSGPYASSSSICCAAIHNGTLRNSEGGDVLIKISYSSVPYFIGSNRNGVQSKHNFLSSAITFITQKIFQQQTSTISVSTTIQPSTEHEIPKIRNTTVADSELTNVVPFHLEKTDTDLLQKSTTTSYPREIWSEQESNSREHEPQSASTPTVSTATSKDIKRLFSTLEIVFLLLGVFASGVLSTLLVFFLKRRRKLQKRSAHSRAVARTKKYSQRYEEGNLCVCYQNMNSSKQGLLYDPETCERQCPIRKPFDEGNLADSLIRDDPKSFDPKVPDNAPAKRPNCKIRYEENNCATECSGACNPDLFEF